VGFRHTFSLKPILLKEIDGLVGNKLEEKKDVLKNATQFAEQVVEKVKASKANLVIEELDVGKSSTWNCSNPFRRRQKSSEQCVANHPR
jgi:hypothetical protein